MERVKIYIECAKKNGMCKEGRIALNSAMSKKDMIDVLFSIQGVDFFCESTKEKWCLDSKTIVENFGSFMNGNYTYDKNYKSEMYCRFKGLVLADKSLYMFYDSNATVNVPKHNVCMIHVCGNSNVKVIGKGVAEVITYGEKASVDVSENPINFKEKNL